MMKPERWRQVDQLFQAALERAPKDRSAFINEACGDDDSLRREVEALLAADGEAGSLIETPAYAVAAPLIVGGDAPTLLGKTISHYQIISLLGKGGMGEIYRARDTKLDRAVALKILSEAMSADGERMRRFSREAKAASALNHPNVAHIYEIGEAEGVNFIAMEYVEGQTLAARINGQPLEINEIIEIGSQIADALDEAHRKGITHRDLKPANVMLNERGQVKVLDFGLAKIARPTEQPVASDISTMAKTASGVVMGTVPYMSPEQALGREVDHRSDLFSLGAVLYEMVTGRMPFAGSSTSEILDRILHSQPEAMARFNYDVPAELERIVRKCLEKEPERRYQSARELLVDLKNHQRDSQSIAMKATQVATPSRSRRRLLTALAVAMLALGGLALYLLLSRAQPKGEAIKSLVVLPLENLSGDPAQEYFADGMTDALIGELAKIGALRVISRTSAMHYKGKKKSLPEIARELNVDAVIEGTVQRLGDRVRVRAQLVRAATEQSLWSRNWDQDLRNVLSLQSEIAQAVAHEVQIKLTPAEQTRLASARPVNSEAYQAYLNGIFYWNQARQAPNRDAEELYTKSFGYFEQAIKIDPNYAQAYAGLARSYHWLASRGHPFYKFYPQARAAAQQALALDETLAEAHDALAFTLWRFEWDWAGAEREYKRAIELGADSEVHHGYGLYLSAAGHHTEAIAEMKRAQELDPLTLPVKYNLGFVYSQARQYDQAIEQFRNLLDLAPNNDWVRINLGVAYVYQHRYEAGIAEIQRVVETAKFDPSQYPRGYLAWAYAESGKSGEALRMLDELKALAKQYPVLTIEIARTYAVLGEKDRAIDWLERAYQARTYRLLLINCFPEFDGLRSDPRWKALLRRLNFPER
jgi:serine/threonine-protein kinase